GLLMKPRPTTAGPRFGEYVRDAELVLGEDALRRLDVEAEDASLIQPEDVDLVLARQLREAVTLDEVARHFEVPERLDVRTRMEEHRARRPDQTVSGAGGEQSA